MSDLISRAAAIEVLGERPMVWTDDDQYALGERSQYDRDRLAIGTLPSAEKVGEWIPVSERPPEEEYEVLVTTSWHDVCIAWYDDGKWRAEYINEYDDDEILAWMPLPEPWRGEEDV